MYKFVEHHPFCCFFALLCFENSTRERAIIFSRMIKNVCFFRDQFLKIKNFWGYFVSKAKILDLVLNNLLIILEVGINIC